MLRINKSRNIGKEVIARILTIDDIDLTEPGCGVLSVGPDMGCDEFSNHKINKDLSLGDKPPFLDVKLASSALFETADGNLHVRLFDGRPGSEIFPGVTPDQAKANIINEFEIKWGVFLDPGQTSKIVAYVDGKRVSFGNRHYLKWPKANEREFIWTPDQGRPVASMIAIN